MTNNNVKICVENILPHHQQRIDNIKETSNSSHHEMRLMAAFYTEKIWPNNTTITIGFMSEPSIQRTPTFAIMNTRNRYGNLLKVDPLQHEVDNIPDIRKAIIKIVKERIQPLVNLKLIFIKDFTKAHVRISFNPNKGCFSLVGTDCLYKQNPKEETMNFAWFDVATVVHEFCHLLGMIHEHQNPRGNPIKWDVPKVLAWAHSTQGMSKDVATRNIVKRYNTNQVNGSQFDPDSIMLYFYPPNLTTNNQGTSQNLTLSNKDVEWITKTYPIDGRVTTTDPTDDDIDSGMGLSPTKVSDTTIYTGLIFFAILLITIAFLVGRKIK